MCMYVCTHREQCHKTGLDKCVQITPPNQCICWPRLAGSEYINLHNEHNSLTYLYLAYVSRYVKLV